MSDVRGASGAPGTAAFGGLKTPTPSTPLYVDLSTGDLYVLINEAVTLVGSLPAASNMVLTQRAFAQREIAVPAAFGNASEILGQRAFLSRSAPSTWN